MVCCRLKANFVRRFQRWLYSLLFREQVQFITTLRHTLDLPIDVKAIIWRRVRFLKCREQLQQLLAQRTPFVVEQVHTVGPRFSVHVGVPVVATDKYMYIERAWDEDLWVPSDDALPHWCELPVNPRKVYASYRCFQYTTGCLTREWRSQGLGNNQ